MLSEVLENQGRKQRKRTWPSDDDLPHRLFQSKDEPEGYGVVVLGKAPLFLDFVRV
jgi:hypothetical protein